MISVQPSNFPKITVIDAIMGSGKTSWMIEHMRQRHGADLFDDEAEPSRFLYIATTLDEVERIKAACPEMAFHDPFPEGGRKINGLNRMIREGRNICSTHSLFRRFNRETYEALEEQGYTLVIDEVVDCVEQWQLGKDDKRTLFETGLVYVDGRGRLRWNHELWPDYDGRFSDIRDFCDNGNLVWHRGKALIWELPVDMLARFDEAYILTYLFPGSLMRSYFDLHGVPYEVVSVANGELLPVDQVDEATIKAQLRELITVVDDPKLNAVGEPRGREQPLSKTWFERKQRAGDKDKSLARLKLNTENFFRHHARTPTSANMWTTFKDHSKKVKGRGYARGFVPVNCKATNDHIERRSLAYLANVFVNPMDAGYFQDHGIRVDEEAYALSELLQWVWRSQIRRGDPILLYIPSKRMRELFTGWLNADTNPYGAQVHTEDAVAA